MIDEVGIALDDIADLPALAGNLLSNLRGDGEIHVGAARFLQSAASTVNSPCPSLSHFTPSALSPAWRDNTVTRSATMNDA